MSGNLRADRVYENRAGAKLISDTLANLGWTQAILAEHLEVRRATVNDWIKGRDPIPKCVRLYLPLLARTVAARREQNG